MATLSCPNCGAPAQQAPGQTTIPCTFCGRTFTIDVPAPPPAASPSSYGAPPPAWGPPPPQPAIPPQIVIVPPGASYGRTATAAATFMGVRLLFSLLPVGIALFVAGIVAFSNFVGRSGVAGGALGGLGGWSGTSPLVCGGNEEITGNGITASLGAGPVINAGGNCHVQCIGCNLKANVVITAGGNAQIDLIDTHIEGAQAVVAGGNAEVHLTGSSTMVGQVVQGGNASVTAPPGATSNGVKAPAAATTQRPSPTPTVTSSPSHAVPNHVPSSHH